MAKETKKVTASDIEEVTGVGNEEEMVTMPASKLERIMNRLERLENPGLHLKPKRAKEHFAYMRLWKDKLVTRIGNAVDNDNVSLNDSMRMTLDAEVTDKDGTVSKVTLPYLNFLNDALRVRVKIEKITKEERPEFETQKGGGGLHYKHGTDSEGRFTDMPTGEQIPLTVTFVDTFVDVRVVEGDFEGTVVNLTPATINVLNI